MNKESFLEEFKPGIGHRSIPAKQYDTAAKNNFFSMDEAKQNDRIDYTMGFSRFDVGPSRLGWLVNAHETLIDEGSEGGRSGVDLYFLQDDGSTFKSTLLFKPYFYVLCVKGSEDETVEFLRRRFGRIDEVGVMEKEDLDLKNHLSGVKAKVVKVTFINNEHFRQVKNQISSMITVQESTSESMQGVFDYGSTKHIVNNNDPSANIVGLREYDIMYYSRVMIDLGIRVGMWYDVTPNEDIIELQPRQDIVTRADPVVLAFDIETTKLPLRFPDAAFDSIIMISYMIDGVGFLITNREIVSLDISDFEYTPSKEYLGQFTIFNEPDEKAVLNRFFEHVRAVRPTVFVTYNGDFFDWPFIDTRATVNGFKLEDEIGFHRTSSGEYLSSYGAHMDCYLWVKRDSYLPQGSQNLKAVAKYKLGYDPVELDPELMTRYASERPQVLAQYSVSDAVATYYLYMKYVHPFTFSLCNVIPMHPDDVLRRGSGTLCEHLLMTEAFVKNVMMPNKYVDKGGNFYDGHMINSETYVGGHVEALEAGVFRADLETRFSVVPEAIQQLIDEVDQALTFTLLNECKVDKADVLNYDSVKSAIQAQLRGLKEVPHRLETPLIYHLDVAAMYPNIILTNRLQPDAIVTEATCASCDFNLGPASLCQRKMEWSWRGEFFKANKSEYNLIYNQLSKEHFEDRAFHELKEAEKEEMVKKRLVDYSRKVYGKTYETKVVEKDAIVCQRENPFYVDTVRDFRDRRYEYKALLKQWKGRLQKAYENEDALQVDEAKRMVVIFDSLQTAHKCILNSFYGYVMRKGARWYSMEMAGVVCLTGARIIQLAKDRVEQIGKPLELDTDGIWCCLPSSFPENFEFELKGGKKVTISYPCVMLNHLVHDQFTNHQYQEKVGSDYVVTSENSIFFEVDGPYLAMILPASTEEGKLLKKRYAVFNMDGSIAELKGFELKRRGELKLIKNFQGSIFKVFLEGKSLEECYRCVAGVADQWLDILYSKGRDLSDEEVFDLVSENRSMSKVLSSYGAQKSTSITTAKRLAEFLGSDMIEKKGLNCHFIITKKPIGAPVSERAVPIAIFQSSESVKRHFLGKWLQDVRVVEDDIRTLIDWDYYLERFTSVLQKLITIPAVLQGCENPVKRVLNPDWLGRKDPFIQTKLSFKPLIDSTFIDSTFIDSTFVGSTFVGSTSLDSTFIESKSMESKSMESTFTNRVLKRRIGERLVDSRKGKRMKKSLNPFDANEDYLQFLIEEKKGWKVGSGVYQRKGGQFEVVEVVDVGLVGAVKVFVVSGGLMSCLTVEVDKVFYLNSTIPLNSSSDLPLSSGQSVPSDSNVPSGSRVPSGSSGSSGKSVPSGIGEKSVQSDQNGIGVKSDSSGIGGKSGKSGKSVTKEKSLKSLQSVQSQLEKVKFERVGRRLPKNESADFLYRVSMSQAHFNSNTASLSSLLTAPTTLSLFEGHMTNYQRALIQLPLTSSIPQHQSINLNDILTTPLNKTLNNSYLTTTPIKVIYLYQSDSIGRQMLALVNDRDILLVFVSITPVSLTLVDSILNPDKENHHSTSTGLEPVTSTLSKGSSTGLEPVTSSLSKEKNVTIVPLGTPKEKEKEGFEQVTSTLSKERKEKEKEGIEHVTEEEGERKKIRVFTVKNGKEAYKLINTELSKLKVSKPTIILTQTNQSIKVMKLELARLREFPTLEIPNHKSDSAYPALLWQKYSIERLEGRIQLTASFLKERLELARFANLPVCNIEKDYCVQISDLLMARQLKDVGVVWEREADFEVDLKAPEISVVGCVDSICLELEIWDLPLSTLVKSAESFLDASTTGLVDSESNTTENVQFEMKMIRHLIKDWMKMVKSGCEFASHLLEHLHRWITSKTSLFYDPKIVNQTQIMMKRRLAAILDELKRLGSQIVYASFDKIVISTSKTTIQSGYGYTAYVLKSMSKNPDFEHIELKPVCFHSYLIWYDVYNHGSLTYYTEEGMQIAQSADSLTAKVNFNFNVADYLPLPIQEHFMNTIAEYLDAVRSEAALGDFVELVLKRRLLKVVKEIHGMRDLVFPTLPGSSRPMTNATLEFIKTVCMVLLLNPTIDVQVRSLKKDLLRFIDIREFASEAIFTNPCEKYVLHQVICTYCNRGCDLDLTRKQSHTTFLSCESCDMTFDRDDIEQRLISDVEELIIRWQVQDLVCIGCRLVVAEELRGVCVRCAGKLKTVNRGEVVRGKVRVMESLAVFFGMEALNDVVSFIINLI